MRRRAHEGERDTGRLVKSLGDFPIDRGSHAARGTDAMRRQLAPQGYRPEPTRADLARKFATEAQLGHSDLLRLNESLQHANITAQPHPIADVPFFGQPVHFASTTQSVVAGGTSDFTVLTVIQNYTAFIRTIVTELLTPGAETDLRLSMLINGSPWPGLSRVAAAAFIPNIRDNTYLRAMQRQVVVMRFFNDGAVVHTFRAFAFGWQYPNSRMEETAQGSMPNT